MAHGVYFSVLNRFFAYSSKTGRLFPSSLAYQLYFTYPVAQLPKMGFVAEIFPLDGTNFLKSSLDLDCGIFLRAG